MKITNKNLAILVITSILFSVFSIFITLNQLNFNVKTGFFSGDTNATVYFEIDTVLDINFTLGEINFGAGYVIPGNENCTINTVNNYSPSECYGFNNLSEGFLLENIGTTPINLSFRFSTPVETFLNNQSEVRYRVSNNELNSCTQELNPLNFSSGVVTDTNYTIICSNFSNINSQDSLRIDMELVIDDNITGNSGQNTMFINAQAQQI